MSKQVIFHGGCIGCSMQQKNGLGYCTGCCYFEGDWSLPNLNDEDIRRKEELHRQRELARKMVDL